MNLSLNPARIFGGRTMFVFSSSINSLFFLLLISCPSHTHPTASTSILLHNPNAVLYEKGQPNQVGTKTMPLLSPICIAFNH
jgi:hypothetical protein